MSSTEVSTVSSTPAQNQNGNGSSPANANKSSKKIEKPQKRPQSAQAKSQQQQPSSAQGDAIKEKEINELLQNNPINLSAKQIQQRIDNVSTLFPDWDLHEIANALKETDYDVATVIESKLNGNFAWKTKSNIKSNPQPHAFSSPAGQRKSKERRGPKDGSRKPKGDGMLPYFPFL